MEVSGMELLYELEKQLALTKEEEAILEYMRATDNFYNEDEHLIRLLLGKLVYVMNKCRIKQFLVAEELGIHSSQLGTYLSGKIKVPRKHIPKIVEFIKRRSENEE